MTDKPLILWVRRDLRLADNPALAACGRDRPPGDPGVHADEASEALGAAPKWRLGQGLAAFARR
jgi:deoxyribodipyrimidine photo-lyase